MKLPVRHRQQLQELAKQDHNNTVGHFLNDDFFQPFFNWQPFLSFKMMRPMRRILNQVENFLPHTDVSETDKELKVALDIPHVDPKNVDITVEGDSLIVSGKTEEEQEEKGKTWHQIERQYGEFRRVIDLSAGIETDKITAKTKHGTLYITIPKKPDAQRKQIKVDIKK